MVTDQLIRGSVPMTGVLCCWIHCTVLWLQVGERIQMLLPFSLFLLSYLNFMEKFLPIFCLEGKSLIASILGDKLYKNLRGPHLSTCNLPCSSYSIQYNTLRCRSMYLPFFTGKKSPVYGKGKEGQLPTYIQWQNR